MANDVWGVGINGQLAVARRGVRSEADLAWETELLLRLDREGLTVPVPIPTTDGRLFADAVVVMTYATSTHSSDSLKFERSRCNGSASRDPA